MRNEVIERLRIRMIIFLIFLAFNDKSFGMIQTAVSASGMKDKEQDEVLFFTSSFTSPTSYLT